MNTVQLVGRLTDDPELRRTTSNTKVCNFAVAVNRYVKDGEEKKADFPRVKIFGNLAEVCKTYLSKGSLVGVKGRLQTGSYEKDGHKYFTTEVVAEFVEFLERKPKEEATPDTDYFNDLYGI